jgi:hypothetical protein
MWGDLRPTKMLMRPKTGRSTKKGLAALHKTKRRTQRLFISKDKKNKKIKRKKRVSNVTYHPFVLILSPCSQCYFSRFFSLVFHRKIMIYGDPTV